MRTAILKKYKLVEEIIYYPQNYDLMRHKKFRQGQKDRNAGEPALSNNGVYLDGYYSPDKKAYFISEDQVDAFNL